MSSHGRTPGQNPGQTPGRMNGEFPDMTARVMQQLGYVQADPRKARALRRRAGLVRLLQGVIVLSAVALGAVWWFSGSVPVRRSPEVVDTLRGSLARGAGELDGFLAGLPRLPKSKAIGEADVTLDASLVAQPPSAALEGAPQLRSY